MLDETRSLKKSFWIQVKANHICEWHKQECMNMFVPLERGREKGGGRGERENFMIQHYMVL